MSTLLVLDPAESTGYCLVRIDEKTSSADIYEYGFIDIDTKSNYMGDWMINLQEFVEKTVKAHNVDSVTVEDYFFGSKFASGSNVNPMYRAAIYIKTRQLGLHYDILNISAWKTFCAGRSTPTKEQKAKWGKEAAKKLYMQQALFERHGFRFPNHSISIKTGKPILFRYDIVDAVAQALYACRIIKGINTVTLSVPVAPDVEFKGAHKKLFVYSS